MKLSTLAAAVAAATATAAPARSLPAVLSPTPADPVAPARSTLPGDVSLARLASPASLVYVEAPGLASLLRRGLDDRLFERLRSTPAIAEALDQRHISPEAGVTVASLALGRPLLPTLARLCEGGIALAGEAGERDLVWSLVGRAADARTLVELREEAFELLTREQPGAVRALSSPDLGEAARELWAIGDELVLGAHGEQWWLCRTEADARAILTRAIGEAPGLAGEERYRHARATRATGDFAWALGDLGRLRDDPEHAPAFEDFRRAPQVSFLLGPHARALGSADEVCVALGWRDDGIDLRVHALGDELQDELMPPIGARARALPYESERGLARATLYRDLAGLFDHRAELFSPRVLPDFAEALSNLALFVGGADVSKEVLPYCEPWLRLYVEEPRFAAEALPDTPLPAAAIVVELTDPEHIGPLFESAFQTAIGLVNVDRAQEGGKPLVMRLHRRGETTVTTANLVAPREGEGVDVQYNLVPACARVGEHVVLGTHVSLVERLVDALAVRGANDEPPHSATEGGEAEAVASSSAAAGREALTGESLHLRGAPIADAIAANRTALTMNAVLRDGKAEVHAEAEVRFLEALVRLVDDARLRVGRRADGHVCFEFELNLAEDRQ